MDTAARDDLIASTFWCLYSKNAPLLDHWIARSLDRSKADWTIASDSRAGIHEAQNARHVLSKIVFISLYDLNAQGIRLMSANLMKHSHHSSIVFLKRHKVSVTNIKAEELGPYAWVGVNNRGQLYSYQTPSPIHSSELKCLRELLLLLEPDVIGITVNTPMRANAIKVTQFIKSNFNIPVIWGGFDPTINYCESLKYCDYACIGEGDQTIIDIAEAVDKKQSFDTINNLAFIRNGKLEVNPLYPLCPDIDKLPWRDNSPGSKYLIEEGRLIEETIPLNDKEGDIYQTMSSRGCPFSCSYCCEAQLKRIYQGQKLLRRRSPYDVVKELALAEKQFKIKRIQFEDEVFPLDLIWLKQFVPLYTAEVKLPFAAYIYPVKNIDEILPLLHQAGLDHCCLALESGSQRINKEVFHRSFDRDLFLKTAKICRRYNISFYTDIITYNPCETEEDLEQTLGVLTAIPGRYDIFINKLLALPGTAISQMLSNNQGVISISPEQEYLFNYYSRLFWIASFGSCSKIIIRVIQFFKFIKTAPKIINPLLIKYLINPQLLFKKVFFLIKSAI